MREVLRVQSIIELRECIKNHQPCIYSMPQSHKEWCHHRWTKEFWADKLGSKRVIVRSSPSKRYIDPADPFWSWVQSLLAEEMSCATFLQEALDHGKIISGTDTYLYHQKKRVIKWGELWDEMSELIYDDTAKSAKNDDTTSRSGIFPLESLNTVGLWLSGSGVKSMLHYDTSKDHNLNFQLSGQKRITLFPPSDWPKLNTFLAMGLHPFEAYQSLHSQSKQSADQLQGHLLKDTHPQLAVMDEGEVLLIPTTWFHFVEHEGTFNVNLTCWFTPEERSDSTDLSTQVKIDLPKQSSRDYFLISRLLFAFILANLLNLFYRLTRLPLGPWICRRMLK